MSQTIPFVTMSDINAEHTPGPWWTDTDFANGHRTQIRASHKGGRDCVRIAEASVAKDSSEREANARLIAAAPDLLAALRKALNFIENTESEMGEPLACGDAARAAIAKATGQS